MLNQLRKCLVAKPLAELSKADVEATTIGDARLNPLYSATGSMIPQLPQVPNVWIDQRISKELFQRFAQQASSHAIDPIKDRSRLEEILRAVSEPSDKLRKLVDGIERRWMDCLSEATILKLRQGSPDYLLWQIAGKASNDIVIKILERINSETTFFRDQLHNGGVSPLVKLYAGETNDVFIGAQPNKRIAGEYREGQVTVYAEIPSPSEVCFRLLKGFGLPNPLGTYYHELEHKFEDVVSSEFKDLQNSRQKWVGISRLGLGLSVGGLMAKFVPIFSSAESQFNPARAIAVMIATLALTWEGAHILNRRMPLSVDPILREAFARFRDHLSPVRHGSFSTSVMQNVEYMSGGHYPRCPTDPARVLYVLQSMEELYLLGASNKDIAVLVARDAFNIFSRRYPLIDEALEKKFKEWGDLNLEQRRALIDVLRTTKLLERNLASAQALAITLLELRAACQLEDGSTS